jgi:uncharacterized protein YxjI
METFEVTQKLLSFGPQYEVTSQGSSAVLATVKGKILTASPKLTMFEGSSETEIAFMSANFMKTKFECFDAKKQATGVLAFPMFAFKKGFALTVGGVEYKADGGFFGGEFKCSDPQGNVVFVIAKQLALRDKFAVTTTGVVPRDVALLAAIAIDQKFFTDEG